MKSKIPPLNRILAYACLSIIFVVPQAECVNYSYPNPIFQWKAQTLSRCNQYGGPKAYTTCIQEASKIEVSRPAGDFRACTSDPSTLYSCSTAASPGCFCNSLSNVYECGNIQVDATHVFGPMCFETIFAVEGSRFFNEVRIIFVVIPSLQPLGYTCLPTSCTVPTGCYWGPEKYFSTACFGPRSRSIMALSTC